MSDWIQDWVVQGEELQKGGTWYCEKCQKEHQTEWRIVRIIRGKNYQLWKGPHMIGSCKSAEECKIFAEDFNLGDLF